MVIKTTVDKQTSGIEWRAVGQTNLEHEQSNAERTDYSINGASIIGYLYGTKIHLVFYVTAYKKLRSGRVKMETIITLTSCLLYAQDGFKHFMCPNSFGPHNNPVK